MFCDGLAAVVRSLPRLQNLEFGFKGVGAAAMVRPSLSRPRSLSAEWPDTHLVAGGQHWDHDGEATRPTSSSEAEEVGGLLQVSQWRLTVTCYCCMLVVDCANLISSFPVPP